MEKVMMDIIFQALTRRGYGKIYITEEDVLRETRKDLREAE